MRFRLCIVVGILCILLLISITESAKGRGSRRRGKTRKGSNSPRNIFFSNSKRKEYYDNPNGAQIIKASHFDYEFYLGHKIVFICVAKGDPAPRITWFKDGIELYTHPYLQVSEWRIGSDKIKSKLEIDPARQMDSGTYECQANNKYTVDRRNFKADF